MPAAARRRSRCTSRPGREVRAYDLRVARSSRRCPRPGPPRSRWTATAHRFYIGDRRRGDLGVDTISSFDSLRAERAHERRRLRPGRPSRTRTAPVERLHATGDGATLAAALPGDLLVTIDAGSGATLSSTTIPGLGGMADGGTSEVVTVNPVAVADTAALAAERRADRGHRRRGDGGADRGRPGRRHAGHRRRRRSRRRSATRWRPRSPTGRLPGVAFEQRSRLAVASAAGVLFLDPATGATTDTVAMDGVPLDLVPVTGVARPPLYAAGDRSVWRIDLGTGSSPAPPSVTRTVAMPGVVTRITYNAAAQMVHVLGTTPDGDRADRLRHRAERELGLRRRAPADRARRVGDGREQGLPRDGPPAAPHVRRGRVVRERVGRGERVRLAAARGHPRLVRRRRSSTSCSGSSSGAGPSRCSAGSSSSPTG